MLVTTIQDERYSHTKIISFNPIPIAFGPPKYNDISLYRRKNQFYYVWFNFMSYTTISVTYVNKKENMQAIICTLNES